MTDRELYEAIGQVDEKYLDIVDTPEKENTYMKRKHFTVRKTITYILAAAICISILTVTAMAAGWIPNIFASVEPAFEKDAEILEAALQVTQTQEPETVTVPEVDYTQFTLYERYYDGASILLGYDLSKVMPEPVVGCVPEGELKEKLMEMPEYQRASHPDLTDDTLELRVELGIYTQEQYEEILDKRSEYAKKHDLRKEYQIIMDLDMKNTLSPEQYEAFWKILEETGSCCVAIPSKPWIADHIYVNDTDCGEVLGPDCGNFRTDYETDVGDCILLSPLPDAGLNQDSVEVELTLRSGWYYWYMELDGDVYSCFENNTPYPAVFTLENVNN